MSSWAGRVPTGATFWNCVTCLDRLILRDWSYRNYGPAKSNSNFPKANTKVDELEKKNIRFPGSRIDFGSEISGQARGIERFWQVKNIPSFSDENPALVPTRGAFILVQAVAVVLCYFVNNWTVAITFRLDPNLLSSEHVPFLTRLPKATVIEMRTRIVGSIGYWIVQYCNLQFFYSLFGLVGAILNPQEIHLWRPLFGNPKDAYTIRNFWG